MTPIHELLARIRWDPEFARGTFELAYEDKVAHRIVRVPLARVHFEPGNHFSFDAIEDDGSVHTVPLHRVREVRRDGIAIRQRHPCTP